MFLETKQLFLEDAYLRACEATVVAVRRTTDDRIAVVLDQTVFHPTAGGQATDQGWLEVEKRRYRVVEARQEGRIIVHVLGVAEADIGVGYKVRCEIDWERRYRLMQHHTLAHLLTPAIRRVLGAPVEIVSARKTPDKAYLDIRARVTREQLQAIEALANQVIQEGRRVLIHYMPRPQAEAFCARYGESLRLLPLHVQTVRVVEIENWHAVSCCGTHVRNTREIGGVKILKRDSKGRGVDRITFVAVRA